MEVIIVEDVSKAEDLAAKRIKNLVKSKPQCVLGLATGQTLVGVYQALKVCGENCDFSQVITFNLDEYVGLGAEHPASYACYTREKVVEPLGLNPDHCFAPNGLAENLQQECERYEQQISQSGPIDLQLLGLGRDGHIAFNEPGSSLGSKTRLKTLTETTRRDNQSFFRSLDEVPRHVMTMGVHTILQARSLLLLAFGESKAEAVASFIEGPLSAQVPASALQLHPKVQVILDEGAAARLKNRDYYKEVFAGKPTWQNQEFV